MFAIRSVLLTVLLLCAPVGIEVVRAQAPTEGASQVRARKLFIEGGELLNARDYGAAESRFREALQLFAHPPIAYNLAIALEKQGRFKEALDVLDRGLKAAFGELDEAQQSQYRARIDDVRRLLAQLIVRVDNPATLYVDGRKMGELDAGATEELSLDPGSHLVIVEFAEGKVERSVRLATSGREELDVDAPPSVAPVSDGEVAASPDTLPSDDASSTVFESPWFWVGTVAVVGGAVAAFLILSESSSGGVERDPVWGLSETLTGP